MPVRMSGDVWEPWQPKAGDRVRTVINPECRQQLIYHGRYPEGSALTGVIGSITPERRDGHRYVLVLDGDPKYHMFVSAAEIEPLETAS